jgi:hypothetical protein
MRRFWIFEELRKLPALLRSLENGDP